jgi:hypothetical protein
MLKAQKDPLANKPADVKTRGTTILNQLLRQIIPETMFASSWIFYRWPRELVESAAFLILL